jgi:DNA excision repair protein ERCC-2
MIIQKEMLDDAFFKLLRKFTSRADEWLEENILSDYRDEFVDFYFEVRNFLRVAEDYDKRFITYIKRYGNNVTIKQFCLDPSHLLKEALNRGNTAIFYSATLTPLDYFIDLLGGDKTSSKLLLPSPFPKENLCLMLNDGISTRYIHREKTYEEIAELIEETIKVKVGNYLVFSPSYEYMKEILEEFKLKQKGIEIIVQEQGMSEEERSEFLERFSSYGKKSLVGFAVMGGIFGEGIDLIGEKLSGAVVVGVGLPKVSPERDMIKNYFDALNNRGFVFAYTYPGMNKVLQAAGRVIRTMEDKGVVLLIGERYSTRTYSVLFPDSWSEVQRIFDTISLSTIVKEFWKGK